MRRFYYSIICVLLLAFTNNLHAQYGDCFTSAPLTSLGSGCTSYSYPVTPSGFGTVDELAGNNFSNPFTNPNCCNAGCLLGGELNSTWIVFTITSGGLLEFVIGGGPGATPGCIDWAMWPYNSTACADIAANALAPVACNWNGACTGYTGMANAGNIPVGGNAFDFETPLLVTAGQQFVLCISNWSGQNTTFPFNIVGTAQVNCGATDVTICEGDTGMVLANAAPGSILTWAPNPFMTVLGAGDSALVYPPVTTDFYLTITDTNGVSSQDTSTVTVVPTIVPTITVVNNNCETNPGGAINVSTTGGGGSITYDLSGPVTQQNTTGIFTGLPQGTYTITMTPALNAACAVSATATIGFDCGIQDATICQGDTTMIHLVGYVGYTRTWDPGPNMTISTTQDTAWVHPNTTTAYVVHLTDTSGNTIHDTAWITVVPTIIPTTVTKANDCSNFPNGSIVITATGGLGPLTYNITGPTTSTNTTGIFNNIPDGTYTITIFPTNYSFCPVSYSATVAYIPPTPVYLIGDTALCLGETTTLELVGAENYSILWSTGDTLSTLPVFSLTDTVISVVLSDSCENLTFTTTVVVNTPPVVNAGLDTSIYIGNSVTLDGSGGASYVWNPPTGLDCFNCEDPIATPNITTSYVLTVLDSNGCIGRDVVTVEVIYLPLFVPTAFSPNGDDENDILYVRGAGVTSLNFIIYDRLGNIVFKTQSMDIGWDGTIQGKPASSGVYAYQLSATRGNREVVEMKGNITLVR